MPVTTCSAEQKEAMFPPRKEETAEYKKHHYPLGGLKPKVKSGKPQKHVSTDGETTAAVNGSDTAGQIPAPAVSTSKEPSATKGASSIKDAPATKTSKTSSVSSGKETPTSEPSTKKDPPPQIPDGLIWQILDKNKNLTPLIDIGANLTKLCYKETIPEVLRRAALGGLTHIIITGTNYNSSKEALKICQEYDGVEGITLRCTIGIHPLDVEYTMTGKGGKYSHSFGDSLESLLHSDEGQEYCVAIGECGLDYSREGYNASHQKIVFRKQLSIAQKHRLPIFCHSRKSHAAFLDIIKYYSPGLKVVVHCHTDPSIKNLKELLNVGCYIGLTGINSDLREGRFNADIIPEIPLDRLMVETDSPYLLPRNLYEERWLRHENRYRWMNEPCMTSYVVDRIVQVRGDYTEVEVANATTENAKEFFGL